MIGDPPPPLRPVALPSCSPIADGIAVALGVRLRALEDRVTGIEKAIRRYGGLPTEPMRCRKCRAALSQTVLDWQWIPESQRWAHFCRGSEIGYAAEPDVPDDPPAKSKKGTR